MKDNMAKTLPYLKLMLIAGTVFGLCFALGVGITNVFTKTTPVISEIQGEDDDELVRQDGNRTNILVLGVDARPGEKQSRSDTMMLVSVDPKIDKAAIISIPRDTKIDMPGSGIDKICAANMVGGPEYAVKATEKLMKVKIDYYVEMDFNGFKDIIETLGGVTINVPHKMYKPSEDIDLKPGLQKLNGYDALAFVRFRDYVNGDIDRANAQQAFMKALSSELLQAKTITKLPKLIKQTNQYVTTNMGVADMLRIASWAPGFTADSIIAQTLPGTFYDVRDEYGTLTASYWVADKNSLDGLIDNLLAGKTINVVQGVETYQAPKDKDDKDDKDDDKIKLGDLNNKSTSRERAKLPSPGHRGEYDNLINSPTAGPEGYM